MLLPERILIRQLLLILIILNAYIENGNVNLEMRKIDPAMGNFTKAYELDPENNEVIKAIIYSLF